MLKSGRNPPKIGTVTGRYKSRVNEIKQSSNDKDVIDYCYKIIDSMGIQPVEKAEFSLNSCSYFNIGSNNYISQITRTDTDEKREGFKEPVSPKPYIVRSSSRSSSTDWDKSPNINIQFNYDYDSEDSEEEIEIFLEEELEQDIWSLRKDVLMLILQPNTKDRQAEAIRRYVL